METLVIERLQDGEDLDAVATLEAASFTNPWTREMLDRELCRRTSRACTSCAFRVCVSAAFCACWVVLDELHINTIAVDPAHRAQASRPR
jgi:ribosomal protein S18 acetylase RimI-like enzyme